MLMRKQRREKSRNRQDSFLKTMHLGLNYFHQVKLTSRNKVRSRLHTTASSMEQTHHSMIQALFENKIKFQKIKTQVRSLREFQFSDYIRKSNKYQELLNINDNKKKRLPTLNTKVGEVVKKSVADTISKNIYYEVTHKRHVIEGWKPQSREGHTTTVFKNNAIVIGGHCSSPFSNAQVYSLQSNCWTKQFNIHSARSYHSAILYKNRFIIVFGGMGIYDVSCKCRICYNTINLIDLQSSSARILKMSGQETVEGRRSHSATLMGKYMLIFGGMNTKRNFLKDFVYLDLKELRWYHKDYKVEGKELHDNLQTGLAKHKAITSFRCIHKSFPLYSSEYSDQEGLFFFGGYFGNGEQNIVLQMSFNKYNPILKRVDYSGIPPSSMEPILQRVSENIVAIIAGDQADRELRLFKIKEREFVGISKQINMEFLGGIGSTMSKYEDQLVLMFGLGKDGYISHVHSIKIDEKIVQNEITKKKKNRCLEIGWKLNAEALSDDSYEQ